MGDSRAYVMPSPPSSSNGSSMLLPPSPERVSQQMPAAAVAAAPLLENPERYMPMHFTGSYTPDDSSEFLSWLLTSRVPETLVCF